MTTPRRPMPRAQAAMVDDAVMELSEVLRTIHHATQDETQADAWRVMTKVTVKVTNTILLLKRMDTEKE